MPGKSIFKKKKYRIGWVLMSAYPRVNSAKIKTKHLLALDQIRYSLSCRIINKISPDLGIEKYNPQRRYDLVIFTRLMNEAAQKELRRIKAYGAKVIFDANVNYYEIEGEFSEEGARFKPTPNQRASAIFMTKEADYVIADSSYLYQVCQRYNKRVSWIPDAIDLKLFDGKKIHTFKKKVILLWSGVSLKSYHLKLIKEVLLSLNNIGLLIISDTNQFSSVVLTLRERIPCRFLPYNYFTFPKLIKKADILISPKMLNNSYEKGHTELKITVGMAQKLPVVASPQQSYIDCLKESQAGFLCQTPQQWQQKLNLLISDHVLRNNLGNNARRRVLERYSGEIVARKYLAVFRELLE